MLLSRTSVEKKLAQRACLLHCLLCLIAVMLTPALANAQQVQPDTFGPLPAQDMRMSIDRAADKIWKILPSTNKIDSALTDYKAWTKDGVDPALSIAIKTIITQDPVGELDLAIEGWFDEPQIQDAGLKEVVDDRAYLPADRIGPDIECRATGHSDKEDAYLRARIVETGKPNQYRLYVYVVQVFSAKAKPLVKACVDSFQLVFDPITLQFQAQPGSSELLKEAELWVDDVNKGPASGTYTITTTSLVRPTTIALKNADGVFYPGYPKESIPLIAGSTYPRDPVTLQRIPVKGSITFQVEPADTQLTVASQWTGTMQNVSGKPFLYTYTPPNDVRVETVKFHAHHEGYQDAVAYVELTYGDKTLTMDPLKPNLTPEIKHTQTTVKRIGHFSVEFPDTYESQPYEYTCDLKPEAVHYALTWRPLKQDEIGKPPDDLLNAEVVNSHSEVVNSHGGDKIPVTLPGTLTARARKEGELSIYHFVIAGDVLYTLCVTRKNDAQKSGDEAGIDPATTQFFNSFKLVQVPGDTAFREGIGKYWFPKGIKVTEISDRENKEYLEILLPGARKPDRVPMRRGVEEIAVGSYALRCQSYEIPASFAKTRPEDLLETFMEAVTNAVGAPVTNKIMGAWDVRFQTAASTQGGFVPTTARYRLVLDQKKTRLYVLRAETRDEDSDVCAVRNFFDGFQPE